MRRWQFAALDCNIAAHEFPNEVVILIKFKYFSCAALLWLASAGAFAQQQVVVKSLEKNYRKVSGISGATILGDGRPVLPEVLPVMPEILPVLLDGRGRGGGG